MFLKPLSQEMDVELVVNPAGNAMLLHKGKMRDDLIWAQYDQYSDRLFFVTDDGEMQDLGMPIHEPFQDPLMQTRELFLIEVKDDMSYAPARLIKFSAMAGEA